MTVWFPGPVGSAGWLTRDSTDRVDQEGVRTVTDVALVLLTVGLFVVLALVVRAVGRL